MPSKRPTKAPAKGTSQKNSDPKARANPTGGKGDAKLGKAKLSKANPAKAKLGTAKPGRAKVGAATAKNTTTAKANKSGLQSLHIKEFQDAFLGELYFQAEKLDERHLAALQRPFLWWHNVDHSFYEVELQMRGVMARFLALVSLNRPADGESLPYDVEQVLTAVTFIDNYIHQGEVMVPETANPQSVVEDACRSALKLHEQDPRPILPRVSEMQYFHEGWRGILPDATIDLGDSEAFEQLAGTCTELTVLANYVYSALRKCGRNLLPAIEKLLPTLLPADQLLWMHALDAFPGDAQVIGLYERTITATESTFVKQGIGRYLERVRNGVETTGFEM